MAEILKTVGTAGRDHSTLSLWEAANQGDLVTLNQNHVAEVYADSIFTAGVDILGWTTDATHDIRITVPPGQRHTGILGSGVQIQDSTSEVILVRENFVTLEWLSISNIGTSDKCIRDVSTSGTGTITLQNNIIFVTATTGSSGSIHSSQASLTYNIYNNIVYGGRICMFNTGAIINIKNCTCLGAANRSVFNSSGTMTVQNTISMDSVIDISSNVAFTQDHNLTSDATATGTGSLINKISANQFVNITAGSEDLHLKAGADAIDVGVDFLTVAAVDIDGRDRNLQGDIWDMGAHEFLSAAPSTLTPILRRRMEGY